MKREVIIEYLVSKLNYAYCDNCAHDETSEYCDECHRKYQNWALSEFVAEEIAEWVLNYAASSSKPYWITHNEDNPFEIYGECSNCGFTQTISNKLNYCPNCGKEMCGKN